MAVSTINPPSVVPGPSVLTVSSDRGIFSFFKQLAELSLISGALLYLSGWSYLFGYFRAFGLTPGDLTLPVQVALAFSAPVVLTWISISVISAVLILGGVSAKRFPSWLQSGRGAGILLIILLLVFGRLLSDYGVKKGTERAHKDMCSITSDLPIIILALKANVPPFSCADGEDRLLLHANSNYYVFRVLSIPKVDDAVKGQQVNVCIVPESEVHTVKLRPSL
jgi:hypothetical protein